MERTEERTENVFRVAVVEVVPGNTRVGGDHSGSPRCGHSQVCHRLPSAHSSTWQLCRDTGEANAPRYREIPARKSGGLSVRQQYGYKESSRRL